jgi:transposase InsO family protein
MSLRVVTMAELRVEVLLEPERTGDTVAEVSRRRGISRETFYEYKRRYQAGGAPGLEPRSRRPVRSPKQIEPDLEVEICKLRKDHPRWGARRIRAELRRAGVDPPAVSTIHQALRRNHLVLDQPKKRPKATRRFEREVPNDLWQMDATKTHLADATEAWIVDALDDHARYFLAARACLGPTTEAAWACFEEASSRYGLPRQLLSDNGLCFTGRLHGFVVDFERRVRSLGVAFINSRPDHPETLGKLERFHKTLKEAMERKGSALAVRRTGPDLLSLLRGDGARVGPAERTHVPLHPYRLQPRKRVANAVYRGEAVLSQGEMAEATHRLIGRKEGSRRWVDEVRVYA